MPSQESLDKYIDVIFAVGLALKRGDTLHIVAEASEHALVSRATRRAYELGASSVTIEWQSAYCDALRLINADDAHATVYPAWEKARTDALLHEGACYLLIDSPFADCGTDVPAERLSAYMRNKALARAEYNQAILSFSSRYVVAAAANAAWAGKVFPKTDGETATERLWEAIFRCMYIDKSDPVSHWREKQRRALELTDYLNSAQFTALRFTGGGTDLTVGLPRRHTWLSGSVASSDGRRFLPNLPSEECATVPHREMTSGTVRSTKPLVYGGAVIEGLWLTFERGRVVDFGAEAGLDMLRSILDTDDAARYLGEVALVDAEAVIGRTGLLFYTALFDENAACHIALGEGFPSLIEGGESMTREEQLEAGVNRSSLHIDIMIGSKETDVYAVKDSRATKLMEKGRLIG